MKPDVPTLRTYYTDQRLSTRAIAERCGVSHMSIKRWLREYGIERRAAGRGLANRGVEPPSKDELYNLVHVDHLGYREIAAKYGVDGSAVRHWLLKHGIRTPTAWETRRKGFMPELPGADEVRSLYEAGLSIGDIGELFGVTAMPITTLMKRYGISARPSGFNYGKRFECDDGDVVRSVYEQRVDNWLHAQGIKHDYEPSLPFAGRFQADFSANGWFIEIWGVTGSETYDRRRDRKLFLYYSNQLPLINIEAHQIGTSRGTWEARLRECLLPPVTGEIVRRSAELLGSLTEQSSADLSQPTNPERFRFCEAFGETKTIAEWARDPRCIIGYKSLHYRIQRGWDVERALTIPVRVIPPKIEHHTAFEMVRRHKNGERQADIAKDYGTSKTTVFRICAAAEVEDDPGGNEITPFFPGF
jgi:hypothetical protein